MKTIIIPETTRMLSILASSLLILTAAGQDSSPQPPQPRPSRRGPGPGNYTIEQATSDRAQFNTIAFDGLAFLTGEFCCDTFLPPGKVSDFFGFQNMRDVDAARMGHNTSFLTRIANNTLRILNDDQKAQLVALGKRRSPDPRTGDQTFPAHSGVLSQSRGRPPRRQPGTRSRRSHEILGRHLRIGRRTGVSTRGNRRTDRALADRPAKGGAGASSSSATRAPGRMFPKPSTNARVSHGVHVAVMTYASEFFSWYAGSVEADTYFCPEGHGTYFGSFFMKDAPAMHQQNYSISTALTGDSGEEFLRSAQPDTARTDHQPGGTSAQRLAGHRADPPGHRHRIAPFSDRRFGQQGKGAGTLPALWRTRR